MLPPSAIARGCLRWVGLLRTSSIVQSWLILRSAPEYADLTQGQYQVALELLKNIGLLSSELQSWTLADKFRDLPATQLGKVVYERVLELSLPAWLHDADLLIPDSSDIPADAAGLAGALGLEDVESFGAIQNVHARIDLINRKRIGDAGELELIKFLEHIWPGSTAHVASFGDGFGYDIAFRHGETEWHFEVKSTTRRGRMNVHLSRNEFNKSLQDAQWRLIVVGLDQTLKLVAIATVRSGHVEMYAPIDSSRKAKWQSAAFEITAADLSRGICLDESPANPCALVQSLQFPYESRENWFGWLPRA